MTNGQRVLLVRHGEATSTINNSERPLTIAGRQHAECVASWLERSGHNIEEVLHSKKLRARQTAKIFGCRFGVHAAHVREMAGLNPNDDPAPVAETLEVDRRSIIIVSHLPFLNCLASLLLVGDPERLQFQFSDAGAVILARVSGGLRIEAVVGHEMV